MADTSVPSRPDSYLDIGAMSGGWYRRSHVAVRVGSVDEGRWEWRDLSQDEADYILKCLNERAARATGNSQ